MRRAHKLKDNKVCEYPQQCIWFDTETRFENVRDDTIYHHLKFGWACYMRRHHNGVWGDEAWKRFDTRADFWDWAVNYVRPKTKLYLFCHNTSFDLPVLNVFRDLPLRGFELRLAIIDAPPTILRYRSDVGAIMILDTLNIWRMPLSAVGAEIELQKLEMPEDNDLGITWDTYGKRDVEIIRDACIKWWDFLERNDYGSFAPTLAGQSMRVYRHKFMSHDILIDDNPKATKLSRDGYHGARCECFRIGKFEGSFHLLDVNSMYPDVMANHEYPHKLLTHTRYAQQADLKAWLQQYALMARVVLRTAIPFAPIKEHHKLLFPIGEFECVLSTPELKYALEHAEILDIKEIAVYHKGFLFTQMMHELYMNRLTAKREGRKVDAFMFRKIMNSFYGKWGQSGGKWDSFMQTEDLSCKSWIEYDRETGKMTRHRQLGGLVQTRNEEAESRDSFPAIAAHVTAYARMKLWEIITLAGVDNVLYCDTDSVLVNDTGKRNVAFITDKELMGKLSVKGSYSVCEIWGAKDYRFDQLSRTKGVRKDAIWHGTHDVEQVKWSGLRGLVAAGVTDKPITQRIKKHLNRLYDKGVLQPDGVVEPLLVSLSDPL